MSEPTEPRKQIAPDNWESFLEEFADRNNNRRARFDVFKRNEPVEEDGTEAHLEGVKLVSDGHAKNVEIIRIDRSNADAGKIRDTVTNVVGVTVQYDTDGSEDALEITDNQGTLISMRLESKIDGNS